MLVFYAWVTLQLFHLAFGGFLCLFIFSSPGWLQSIVMSISVFLLAYLRNKMADLQIVLHVDCNHGDTWNLSCSLCSHCLWANCGDCAMACPPNLSVVYATVPISKSCVCWIFLVWENIIALKCVPGCHLCVNTVSSVSIPQKSQPRTHFFNSFYRYI